MANKKIKLKLKAKRLPQIFNDLQRLKYEDPVRYLQAQGVITANFALFPADCATDALQQLGKYVSLRGSDGLLGLLATCMSAAQLKNPSGFIEAVQLVDALRGTEKIAHGKVDLIQVVGDLGKGVSKFGGIGYSQKGKLGGTGVMPSSFLFSYHSEASLSEFFNGAANFDPFGTSALLSQSFGKVVRNSTQMSLESPDVGPRVKYTEYADLSGWAGSKEGQKEICETGLELALGTIGAGVTIAAGPAAVGVGIVTALAVPVLAKAICTIAVEQKPVDAKKEMDTKKADDKKVDDKKADDKKADDKKADDKKADDKKADDKKNKDASEDSVGTGDGEDTGYFVPELEVPDLPVDGSLPASFPGAALLNAFGFRLSGTGRILPPETISRFVESEALTPVVTVISTPMDGLLPGDLTEEQLTGIDPNLIRKLSDQVIARLSSAVTPVFGPGGIPR